MTVTVVVFESLLPRSSTTLQVTVTVELLPGCHARRSQGRSGVVPAHFEPDDALAGCRVRGRFCGLEALAVIVEDPPESTVDGFAEQLFMVGGPNGLIVNCVVQSADRPGFAPSVTCPVTV